MDGIYTHIHIIFTLDKSIKKNPRYNFLYDIFGIPVYLQPNTNNSTTEN